MWQNPRFGVAKGAERILPHRTEKVFAKGGLNWTKSSISTNRSECFFRGTKLRKNCGTKKQARLNSTGSSIIPSTPPFANTMLAVVIFLVYF